MIKRNGVEPNASRNQAVEIFVRVPGNWDSYTSLQKQLQRYQQLGGYQLQGDRLVLQGGKSVELRVRATDPMFATVFGLATARPLETDERRAIEQAPVLVLLAGPGGSLEAARQMIQVCAALLAAGGHGIFFDNGARAHARSAWDNVVQCQHDPDCLVWAYCTIVYGKERLQSVGMHTLGHPDAQLQPTGDQQQDIDDLMNFLTYLLYTTRPVEDGHFVGAPDGRYFYETHRRPDHRVHDAHPMFNPLGIWQLTPMQDAVPNSSREVSDAAENAPG